MKYNLEESIYIEVKSLSAIKTRFIFPLERAMLMIPDQYYGGQINFGQSLQTNLEKKKTKCFYSKSIPVDLKELLLIH